MQIEALTEEIQTNISMFNDRFIVVVVVVVIVVADVVVVVVIVVADVVVVITSYSNLSTFEHVTVIILAHQVTNELCLIISCNNITGDHYHHPDILHVWRIGLIPASLSLSPSIVRAFIRAFILSFVHPFIHSIIHSFIHSFPHSLLNASVSPIDPHSLSR